MMECNNESSSCVPGDATEAASKKPRADNEDEVSSELIEATLLRLTRGIPMRELSLMVSEADECEKMLEQEIEILEKALVDNATAEDLDNTSLSIILESPLTPIDRYWTASALLGRMRREMMLPSIHTVPGGDPRFFPAQNTQQASTRKNAGTNNPSTPESQSALELVKLNDIPSYTEQHRNSAQLLALWKKISSNRAALVFKRPVRPEEAPGYTDRIAFPMDLSLIRKLIVSGKITTFQQLHDKIGLICHNCVKYNGTFIHGFLRF